MHYSQLCSHLSKRFYCHLAALVIMLGSAPATAQVAVQGVVEDSNSGLSLPGANIVVEGADIGTVSGGQGQFRLEVGDLPVTLVVSFIGYETKRVEVTGLRPIVVALQETVLEVEDMVVVGSRFVPRTAISSPVPIDNIAASQLAATGQRSLDKALTYSVPSYNSTQQAISDATAHFDPADLRGLGPSRTLVLINGKRKNPSSLVYINDTPRAKGRSAST